MPRIRNLKHFNLHRPSNETCFRHIDELFGDSIKWDLIETHLPDMLRIVLSIKSGKIAASTILRRLGTYSRKNKLYFAFRELGRAVRSIFLLQYLSDVQLRRVIQAATCKSEEFNDFIQWVFFGGEGIIASNLRLEQRKIIKYSHLVANLLILHNVEGMTRILSQLTHEGYKLSETTLAALSPYRRKHVNRFGSYTLDMDREVKPLDFEIPLIVS
jgi:TnpA family transposase